LDSVRSANADSIWLSMPFRASPSRPISVLDVAGSTRRLRSPAAMSAATPPIFCSGRKPSWMMSMASSAVAATTPTAISASSWSSWLRVNWTGVSGIARTTNCPPNEFSGQSVIRNRATSLVPSTVIGAEAVSTPALPRVFGKTGRADDGVAPKVVVTFDSSTEPSSPRSSTTVPVGNCEGCAGPRPDPPKAPTASLWPLTS
jgi:hypothetical protein